MTHDSKTLDDEQSPLGAGTAQMIELIEAEIERLQVSLELARASDAPNRRALIQQHVTRIDERHDALEGLHALRDEAESSD